MGDHKAEKRRKSDGKKRPREDEDETHRKHKKSRSAIPEDAAVPAAAPEDTPKKKHKKSKKSDAAETPSGHEAHLEVQPETSPEALPEAPPEALPEDDTTKPKKKKRRDKGKESSGVLAGVEEPSAASNADVETAPAHDSTKKSKKHKHDSARADDAEHGAEKSEKKRSKKDKRKAVDGDSSKPVEAGLANGAGDEAGSGAPEDEGNVAVTQPLVEDAEAPTRKKSHKTKDRSKKARHAEKESGGEPMEIDVPSKPVSKISILQPANAPQDPEFPFFTQTVSLWLPLFPVGFDRPLSSIADQHLKPLLNHYSPMFSGVLLAYRNVGLAENSKRPDPKNPPTDKTPAVLASVDEYAVGFGWMTADIDLFVPKRGAWLEGTVILQNEGAIGILCFDKFNVSIEAKRLPRSWKFVDLTQGTEDIGVAEVTPPPEDDEAVEAEAGDAPLPTTSQMHATGYWVDESKSPVKGKLRCRIKSFDVGLAGDHGYLSIEGTMLTEEEEQELALQERAAEQRRKLKTRGRASRRLPEFGMTRLGREEQEEENTQKQELYKGSRPVTPDD